MHAVHRVSVTVRLGWKHSQASACGLAAARSTLQNGASKEAGTFAAPLQTFALAQLSLCTQVMTSGTARRHPP